MVGSKAHILVGKTISAIWLTEDKDAIRFDIERSQPIVVLVEGDCCSSSWVEAIENPEAVVGMPVVDAHDLELERVEEYKDGAYFQFYGFSISTIQGTCTIDYRNSSNGYYGGYLSWPDEPWPGMCYTEAHKRDANGLWRKIA